MRRVVKTLVCAAEIFGSAVSAFGVRALQTGLEMDEVRRPAWDHFVIVLDWSWEQVWSRESEFAAEPASCQPKTVDWSVFRVVDGQGWEGEVED